MILLYVSIHKGFADGCYWYNSDW